MMTPTDAPGPGDLDRTGASDDSAVAGDKGLRPAVSPPPMSPTGSNVEWFALGSLLSGPAVWGGVGYLLDQVLGTSPALVILGLVVGAVTSFYIVYRRFGHSD